MRQNLLLRRLATLLAAGALGVTGLALTGCNAVDGLGKDLQESSDNVRNAGDDD